MAEQIEKLRGMLDDLERELANLGELDPTTREKLEQLRSDIQEALDRRDVSSLKQDSLLERLRDAEQDFEAHHPAVSDLVMRLVNTLAQLGI